VPDRKKSGERSTQMLRSLRVAVNATVTSQRERTGIATFGVNLLEALGEVDGDNVYSVFILNDSRLGKLSRGKFEIISLPRLFSRLPLSISWICWYIWHYTVFNLQLHNINPDAYLSLDFGLPAYSGCPKICMVYDLTPLLLKDAYPAFFRARYRMQVAHAVQNADRIVTISKSAKADIIGYFGVDPDRISVIYPGFDEALFKPGRDMEADKTVLGKYGIDYPYILFVGALEPKKNIGRLIDAFAKVKTDGNIPHRLIIGGKRSWNDAAIFEKIKGSLVGGEISYIGYLPDTDLPAVLRNADVFVFPSLNEGFGIPPLEAMACGTPVITSSVSSLPEVAGGAGMLVNPYDVDDMATAISRVISDRELRLTMVRKGLEQARLFSWHNAARDLLGIIRDTLK
jgi:glycosyltransferase involved in cell wall biosynthesis